MTIQTATHRSTIKTRSSTKRNQLYDRAKYASIGKGPRTMTGSTDTVSKRLTYEVPRKTPARSAKNESRYPYASIEINGSVPSLSQGKSHHIKPRAPIVLASPLKRDSTATKKMQATRPDILSPLASFSPNLRSSSRFHRTPQSKKQKPTIECRALRSPTPCTIPTPTLRITTSNADSPFVESTCRNVESGEPPLEDAYPLALCEFDFDVSDLLSDNDEPLKAYVSLVTGYEDGAFSPMMAKRDPRCYNPIIFSPSQDKSDDNPFRQASLADEVSKSIEMTDIEKIDAELGEFDLFDY